MIKPLSPRQLQVVSLVAQGLANKEIAHIMNVEVGTVKNNMRHIFEKLNLDGRVKVAYWYWENYKQNKKDPE